MSAQPMNNPLNLRGILFTEFCSADTKFMHDVFMDFGFSMLKKFKGKDITYYQQNNIHFLLNGEKNGFSAEFTKAHGPAISSMGWKVDDAEFALAEALKRGAKEAETKDFPYPAIYGIGDSLIYFVDKYEGDDNIFATDFEDLSEPVVNESKGFIEIDHLTNNVYKGTMEKWANFYKDVFGFEEVRYFDIKGVKTALLSYALASPCGTFCIPINEGKDDNNNQIDEYLDIYDGPGVQHLAFRTEDLVASCDALKGSYIETLDIIPEYYDTIWERVPWVKEDKERIKHHQILVDSQADNTYLLQIFTKNLFGPIFIEMIQREGDRGFGEGNFQALFESIERDQERRGVI
ncbi:4-hydroxyphenylpyruvate dioxygenase [Aliikangiella sp. G2MR2-5]|uniref:4-hydroxyphenylpyruvate dioxygenase n=1 Tax=Aliikangiella sp. G2MR2-5 TaxID=2788943 RepID=UPI0018AA458A|nr:4-hydroxyphenylpyruvate dioxygenase [Aliikangiella sp. G2MR2-5]